MYKIIEQVGAEPFCVVYTIDSGSRIVRVLSRYSARADAEQLLRDLASWQ